MAGAKIYINGGTGELGNDGYDNAKVNLPLTPTQAGFVQKCYIPRDFNNGTATYKQFKSNLDGAGYSATGRVLFNYVFNTTSAAFNPVWNTNATTMTAVAASGRMRLNNSAITTTTTGVAMYSCRVFKLEDDCDLRIRFKIKHTNATASNKQAEFGLGYYAFAAGQAAVANEFIGFRFNTAGALVAVLAESNGGAPAEQTIAVSPMSSDGVFREYEMVITDDVVEYYFNSTLIGRLVRSNDNGPILKAIAYPLLMRVFNSGTASAAATFDISSVCVTKYGGEEDLDQAARHSLMGKSTFYAQPDILVASTNPHNFPATTTAPSTAAGSNTASVLNNTAQMGGLYQMTGSMFGATVQSNYLVVGYQNPVVPTAAGAALNVRNLIITSIHISPIVVGTVIVAGGQVVQWFVGIGGSSVITLAGTDANGTTAVAQKAPRLVPLPTVDTLAAAAAVGTVAPRSGDSTHNFRTPLVICPGEFLHIGVRSLQVTAAVTSGNYVGGIYVNGYWD